MKDANASFSAEDDTVARTNVDPKTAKAKLQKRCEKAEKDLAKAKEGLTKEKSAKRKLYSSLVKLANELKRTRAETEACCIVCPRLRNPRNRD